MAPKYDEYTKRPANGPPLYHPPIPPKFWINRFSFSFQVVMQLVRLLPDGHRIKREVDMALDSVSETMTPMHYHLREIIICTYRQVSLCLRTGGVGVGGGESSHYSSVHFKRK